MRLRHVTIQTHTFMPMALAHLMVFEEPPFPDLLPVKGGISVLDDRLTRSWVVHTRDENAALDAELRKTVLAIRRHTLIDLQDQQLT